MTSAAIALLDALAAAITPDAPDDRFDMPFTVERTWYAVQDLSAGDTRVYVTWDGFRPLGRAGNLRLDAHLVSVYLQGRNMGPDALDALDELREQLTDALQDWRDEANGFRVQSLQLPVPYDRNKLSSPSFYQSRILLDCDVLRTVGTAPEVDAPDPPPILTKARTALWDAIAAWPAFTVDEEPFWARKYSSDADVAELMLRDPAAHELPALSLTWGTLDPQALVHRMNQWPIAVTLTAWLRADQESIAQQIVEELIDAVYQGTKTGATIPAVKDALRQYPKGVGPVSITPTTIGRDDLLRAVRVDVTFTLRALHDPFGSQ